MTASRSSQTGLSERIQAVADGRLRVREVVEELIDCIESSNESVRAWSFIDKAAVLREADNQDRDIAAGRSPDKVLYGLVFAAKDNFDTCDMPTAYGSPIHSGSKPARDASCIATLRMAGALLMGKTVTTEFAHVYPGETANPINPEHTPGGSSSGSAAAVASGMVPFAFGTQTTGSVIRPAAYCGVVGFKPSYGDLNVAGVLPNAPSFDTVGTFTRSVQDLGLVHGVLLDLDPAPLQSVSVSGLKVGVCRMPWWNKAEDQARESLEIAVSTLQSAGASITDFDHTEIFEGLEEQSQIVSGFEFSRTLAHERRVAVDQLSSDLREGRMYSGLHTRHDQYVEAQKNLRAARDQIDDAFDQIDVAISLPAPGPAPHGLRRTGDAIFNMPWTTLHTPVISLPLFKAVNGLPMGLQLSAGRHSDRRLMSVAAAIGELFV